MNQHQRGSVLSYSLIAVLLAILLIGGIVYFKNSSTKIATAPFQPTTEGTTDKTSSDTDRTAANDAVLKQQADNKSASSSQNSSSSSSSTANSSTSMPTTSTVTTTALPTTGPENIVLPLLGVSLVTGSAVAYRRSRLAL